MLVEENTTSDDLKPTVCKGCQNETTSNLKCPVCCKNGDANQIFCSQSCFQKNWKIHKKQHKAISNALSIEETTKAADTYRELVKTKSAEDFEKLWQFDPHLKHFCYFEFTGPLRPFPISPRRFVPSDIPQPDYAKEGKPYSEIKAYKQGSVVIHSKEQIERLREVCLLARKATDLAASMIKPGITTDEIDAAVHQFIIENKAYPSPLNYYNFPKSICTSVNEVICHGIPDFRPLKDGDIINVDVTLYYKGMHGDLNETYIVGDVDENSKKLVKTAYDCLEAATKKCKPGVMYRDIGNIIQTVADAAGYSVTKDYYGHGIGALFHTVPNVPHFRKNKAVGVMKPGHVFTIEPMINAGSWRCSTWPDDWTAVTIDGKRSAQFENTLLITETGVEVLTGRIATSPPLHWEV